MKVTSRMVPLQNVEKMLCLDADGKYGIPYIGAKVQDFDETTKWIPFNYVQSYKKDPSKIGVHFYIHDYQFERIWTSPDMYIDKLKKFRYVCTPEFSLYNNTPLALQIWNHYRKHWIGAYYQMHGVNIIPTITWALPQSFEFCFAGEPKNNIVCVSTVGKMITKDFTDIFFIGYEEMKKRLKPTKILINGVVPKEIEDEVIPMKRAYKLFGKTYVKNEDQEK